MNCITPGFPVVHYLLEFAQAHVHWVSDAIQPSHPLSPPSDLALSLSIRVFSNELSSVAQSCPTLRYHGLQHARLPCCSLSPQVCSNSCPWVSDMLSNHLILGHPLHLLPSVFPSIRVFYSVVALHIRWPKFWSFSFSIILSMNIQGWFPLRLTGWISLQSKGLSIVFSRIIQKHQFFGAQPSLWPKRLLLS